MTRSHLLKIKSYASLSKPLIRMPVDCPDIIATCMVNEQKVISVDYYGNSSLEMTTRYHVHHHLSSVDCSEDCIKTNLEEYLRQHPFNYEKLKSSHLSTYLCSTQNKMTSFLKNFVKAPSSPLCSESFFLQMKFDLDGTIHMRGYMWPEAFKNINLNFGAYPDHQLDENYIEETVNFADSLICATIDESYIKERLEISSLEAKNIAMLAKKHQFHYCESGVCGKCKNPTLPLLRTLMVEYSTENYQDSIRFKRIMLQIFQSLDSNFILTANTEDWLMEVFGQCTGDVNNDTITFCFGGETFNFKIDNRLSKLFDIFIGME